MLVIEVFSSTVRRVRPIGDRVPDPNVRKCEENLAQLVMREIDNSA